MSGKEAKGVETVDDFFKGQVYQQSLQANTGWTTVSQAIVASVSKAVIEGVKDVDMDAVERLMALTKTMQQDTIEIMQALKSASGK